MEICVFGASSMTIDKKYTDAVEEMGEFLAKRGHNLVFGSYITTELKDKLKKADVEDLKKAAEKRTALYPSFSRAVLTNMSITIATK